MERVVVVLGYHCAPVEEVPVVREYLDAVISDIKSVPVPARLVILCGGPTFQKSYPGMTEAKRMGEYIRERISPETAIWLEEDSFTTYDNIWGAAQIIRAYRGEQATDITIWCEATRALKVATLARRFIGFPPEHGRSPIKIKTSSWELMHPTLELIATIKDWLAIRLPFLNTIQRAQRIAKAKLR